jgi:hypothetical protein
MARARKSEGEIVEIEVEMRESFNGSISVWDGTMELNPHFKDGRKWEKHTFIPLKFIENTESVKLHKRGKRFILCIPEWLAIDRGLV